MESNDLTRARRQLAAAEADLMTADGLLALEEGLARLETILEQNAEADDVSVAMNLGTTYTDRLYRQMARELGSDAAMPEPALEHLFAVVRALDAGGFEPPETARDVKLEIVERLIDSYFEGHGAAAKEAAYELLAGIAEDSGST